eukprot:scaffold1189_cov194-Amphora_coffeaeformis.AAC.2
MILEQFSTASLSAGEDSWIEAVSSDAGSLSYKTASFYQDSSGRSKVDLPLRLTFASAADLQALLATKCIHPVPNVKEGDVAPWNESGGGEDKDDDDEDRYSFGIEAKVTMTSGSGEAVSATVESVNILASSTTEENVLALETQIMLRVARLEDDGKVDHGSLQGVRLNLEIAAVLSEKSEVEDRDMAASVGLRALYLGRYADLGKTSVRVLHTRLDPISLQVKLSQAFSISARSMSGPNIGETLVSLAISHSNTHQQDVMVSNLALHPAFSRSKEGGQSDQSGAVQWGFAPGAHLKMPLKICPHEAHATILHILGSSETGQAYISPLSVTASVKSSATSRAKSVVAAVEVEWVSASQVPSSSSDALRVDVTVEQDCKVGNPFSVVLRVHNLGQKTAQNLKVVIPRGQTQTAMAKEFCIQMGSDIENDEPNDLLEVDDAVPLGEIRSRESTQAEMRFIALRPGTLKLPQFEIRESGDSNRSFKCAHNFLVVATQ